MNWPKNSGLEYRASEAWGTGLLTLTFGNIPVYIVPDTGASVGGGGFPPVFCTAVRNDRRRRDNHHPRRGWSVARVVGRYVVDGVRRGGGRIDNNIAHEGTVDVGFKAETLIDVVGTF